eukprot:SAG22_NODE_443_length_10453_cov_8.799691_8_plen_48_part_00
MSPTNRFCTRVSPSRREAAAIAAAKEAETCLSENSLNASGEHVWSQV